MVKYNMQSNNTPASNGGPPTSQPADPVIIPSGDAEKDTIAEVFAKVVKTLAGVCFSQWDDEACARLVDAMDVLTLPDEYAISLPWLPGKYRGVGRKSLDKFVTAFENATGNAQVFFRLK